MTLATKDNIRRYMCKFLVSNSKNVNEVLTFNLTNNYVEYTLWIWKWVNDTLWQAKLIQNSKLFNCVTEWNKKMMSRDSQKSLKFYLKTGVKKSTQIFKVEPENNNAPIKTTQITCKFKQQAKGIPPIGELQCCLYSGTRLLHETNSGQIFGHGNTYNWITNERTIEWEFREQKKFGCAWN
jgi:hypothetical protein